MSVQILTLTDNILTLEVNIPLENTMLEGETCIEKVLNEAGVMASGELLKRFETDGSTIKVGSEKFTSKGQVEKIYHTPYGDMRIKRHVYQTSKGGTTFCPLDDKARIINSATPKLAKMISHKYSRLCVDEVRTDLLSNHGLTISRGYIQNVSEMVGNVAQAKEVQWHYSTPEPENPVATVGIGLDGTTIHLRGEGYRETMVGTIALYDAAGERMHTTYAGAPPEYGKSTFIQRMEREIEHIKTLYPDALYIGVADGAADNWSFLECHTSIQVTDYWHATEYLAEAAKAIFNRKNQQDKKKEWLKDRYHKLKHDKEAASRILKELIQKKESIRGKARLEKLHKAISYFTNQNKRMNYHALVAQSLPIGSGVTEAACKMIVKHRLCQSGMKWSKKGASIILSLRTLERSSRWEQFWGKVSQFGAAC